jgi:hypothetical protein
VKWKPSSVSASLNHRGTQENGRGGPGGPLDQRTLLQVETSGTAMTLVYDDGVFKPQVDTGFFVALLCENDAHHDQARKALQTYKGLNLRESLLTTNNPA